MSRFSGKSALVTGAARGIGFEIAMAFAREGAAVAVADLDQAAAEKAAAEITAAVPGARTIGLAANVADWVSAENMVEKAVEVFGKLDALVNNAGITRDNLVLRMKPEDFDAVLGVNLKGAFLASKAASKHMLKARAGAIVNITSVVGQMGNAGQANYAASKAGLIGLTMSMAKEFSSRGVTVNAVAPGFIETKMTEALKPELKAKMAEAIPLGRLGSVADVAAAVLFLASPEASYITGQTLAVNGGLYM